MCAGREGCKNLPSTNMGQVKKEYCTHAVKYEGANSRKTAKGIRNVCRCLPLRMRPGKKHKRNGCFYWKPWKTVHIINVDMKMSDIDCFYFQISGWSDLLQGISNTDNGLKSQVTKIIQFKNQLLSMCLWRQRQITFLPSRTSKSRPH